ncbi:MAG: hypothetical protein RIS70_491, partial [Planctomycetota bacterium]
MKRIFWLFACLPILCVPARLSAQWDVFQPLSDPQVPQLDQAADVHAADWIRPIDAFVFVKRKQANLSPAPHASRRDWIRRVTFDLTGLPPTADEVREFEADFREDLAAMAEVVDRLLASPRYGEHWARHWLDVVRYADSDGFAIDSERLQLWRFRDYVIRVLNEDRPFDQFIREQIAGDEIAADENPVHEASANGNDRNSRGLVAISYYRLGPWEADNMTPEHRRQDYLNDITSNMGSAFLGLTIGCARCHDHKYDPIPQSDFYRLQAFIAPIEHDTLPAAFLPGELSPKLQSRYQQAVESHQSKVKELAELRAALRQQVADDNDLGPDQVSDELLDKAIQDRAGAIQAADAIRHEALKTESANRVDEQRLEAKVVAIRNPKADAKLPDTFVLNNGDVFDPGDKVVPGFLASLPTWSPELSQAAAAAGSNPGGRRRILAEWLANASNPLTTRTLVNRVWAYHFGAGLIATPNDLGANGAGVSHPELLDYLARRLIANQWRLKPLHRELVLSATYRMSSRHPDAQSAASIDPQNRLLWRAPLRRLDSEMIRDAILKVSGRLVLEPGGPGFYEALPEEMERKYSFFNWDDSTESDRVRRSIFMFQRRNLVHPMMEAFDGADVNTSCEARRASVTATQSLMLLNSRLTQESSFHLAEVVRATSADDR